MNQIYVFLRTERKLTIGWCLGLGGFLFLIAAIYGTFDDPAALNEAIEAYPEELLDIFGDIDDLTTVEGFLKAEVGSYLPLILGVFAVMLMTKHTAGAEERGTLDHALSRPITRGHYFWGLLAAGSVIVAILLLASGIGAVLGLIPADVDGSDLAGSVGLMLEFFPISFLYLCLGAMLGSLTHRRAQANGIGIAVVVGFFVLDIASRLVDDLEWLEYWTPHGYLARSDLFNGELDLGYLVFCAALGLAMAVVGALAFDRKNLYA